MDAWGWRIPFLSGIVAIFGAFGVHASVSESPEFEAMRVTPEDSKGCEIISVFCKYWWQTVQISVFVGAGGCVFYNLNVWAPSFLTTQRASPIRGAYLLVSAVT